jgi:O-antigen ligase
VAAILQYFNVAGVKGRLSSISDLGQFTSNIEEGYVARATGPFNHWHLLAAFLMPILLLGVAVALERAWGIISPLALTVSMGLAAVALVLTLTYTVYFGFVAGAIVIGVWARKAHIMAIVLVLVAVAAVFLFSDQLGGRAKDQFSVSGSQGRSGLLPQTVQFRLNVWEQQFLPVIEERPTTGYGAVTPSQLSWTYTESVYITMLLRGGFVLLMVFCAFWIALLVRSWTRVHDPDPGIRLTARALAASALVLIPMQAIFPYFTAPGLPHVIAVLAGLAFAPTHETASDGPRTLASGLV